MSHPLHPGGYCYQLLVVLAKPRLQKTLSTHALHIASGMKAPASGASLATAAPAAEETPKAAVPSEAQSSSLEIKLLLHSRRSRLVALLSL